MLRAINRFSPRSYAAAFAAVLVAIALRWALDPQLGAYSPEILLYGATAFAVWYGGLGPAVAAAVVGYFACQYLFVDSAGTVALDRPGEAAALSLYLIASGLIIAFGYSDHVGRLRSEGGKRHLAHEAQELETAQRAAQRTDRRMSLILDSISDRFYVLDRQWHITYFNKQAEHYFGRSRESVLGRIVWDVFPAMRGTSFETHYRHAMDERTAVRFEARSPVTARWVEAHLYPCEEGLALFFHDVEDRKRAEQALRESEDHLAASNALLELIANGLPVLVSYVDTDERYRFANAAYELWFSAAGVVGKSVREVLSETAYEQVRPKLQRALAGEELRFEARVDYKGAGTRDVSVAYIPDRHEGRVTGFIVLVQDISEYKRMHETLQEADRRKDEFLATLAHELRNPLAPIRNAVQLLRLKGPPDPILQNARDIIERQVTHMVHIVEDLLDVSRITLGRIALRKEIIRLQDVVASAVETAQPMIDASGHELTVSLPSAPVYLHGDATRLSQVLQNLLNNAAKYTRSGGRITLTARREGEWAVVSLRDNGLGIAPEMLPRIFDLFAQIEHSLERSQGGLGIGLTLVRRLVELHGGSVEAHSEGRGRGSEFTVRLPVTARAAPPQQQTQGDAPAASPVRHARRILVADDNRDAACTLAALLKLSGNSVRVAYSGTEALEEARKYRPEIALLDLGMPGMDGDEVCRRMRAEPWGKQMTIIAVTGWGHDEAKRRAAEAGFDEHLTKPIDPAFLDALISVKHA